MADYACAAISLIAFVSLVVVLSLNDYYGPYNASSLITVISTPSKYPTASPSSYPSFYQPSASPATVNPTSPTQPTIPTLAPSASPSADHSFTIEVVYGGDDSQYIREAVAYSTTSWQGVISSPLPDVAVVQGGVYCGYIIPPNTRIDDVLVYVIIEEIDGVGGILGSAGPCAFDGNNMPRFGIVQMDIADVDDMIQNDIFNDVMRHEIGHVLGIGTLWRPNVTYLSVPNNGNGYPYLLYYGNAANELVGLSGSAIVEDVGGSGTAGGHWKESVYGNELMTGYVDSGGMPLSILTVNALRDLGYSVDTSNAESFSTSRRLRSSTKRYYYNCTAEFSERHYFDTIPK